MNEGLGQVLRMGAYSQEVIDRLKWMEHTLYPTLHGGIDTACRHQNGIDIVKIAETGITPVLDTCAAHKIAGKGQVGAGIVRMPPEAFISAAETLVKKYLD